MSESAREKCSRLKQNLSDRKSVRERVLQLTKRIEEHDSHEIMKTAPPELQNDKERVFLQQLRSQKIMLSNIEQKFNDKCRQLKECQQKLSNFELRSMKQKNFMHNLQDSLEQKEFLIEEQLKEIRKLTILNRHLNLEIGNVILRSFLWFTIFSNIQNTEKQRFKLQFDRIK